MSWNSSCRHLFVTKKNGLLEHHRMPVKHASDIQTVATIVSHELAFTKANQSRAVFTDMQSSFAGRASGSSSANATRNRATHRDMVHISVFISVTVESYSGADFTAANPNRNPDKVRECRLQGECLSVNGGSDAREKRGQAPIAGTALRVLCTIGA